MDEIAPKTVDVEQLVHDRAVLLDVVEHLKTRLKQESEGRTPAIDGPPSAHKHASLEAYDESWEECLGDLQAMRQQVATLRAPFRRLRLRGRRGARADKPPVAKEGLGAVFGALQDLRARVVAQRHVLHRVRAGWAAERRLVKELRKEVAALQGGAAATRPPAPPLPPPPASKCPQAEAVPLDWSRLSLGDLPHLRSVPGSPLGTPTPEHRPADPSGPSQPPHPNSPSLRRTLFPPSLWSPPVPPTPAAPSAPPSPTSLGSICLPPAEDLLERGSLPGSAGVSPILACPEPEGGPKGAGWPRTEPPTVRPSPMGDGALPSPHAPSPVPRLRMSDGPSPRGRAPLRPPRPVRAEPSSANGSPCRTPVLTLKEQKGVPGLVVSTTGRAGPGLLRQGDILLAVDGNPVWSVQDFQAALRSHRTPGPASLSVRRGARALMLHYAVPPRQGCP